jgi:hypothetical protein
MKEGSSDFGETWVEQLLDIEDVAKLALVTTGPTASGLRVGLASMLPNRDVIKRAIKRGIPVKIGYIINQAYIVHLSCVMLRYVM